MPKYTSSERKGIIVTAAVALVVTGLGLCVPHWRRSQALHLVPPECDTLVLMEQIEAARLDSIERKMALKAHRDSLRAIQGGTSKGEANDKSIKGKTKKESARDGKAKKESGKDCKAMKESGRNGKGASRTGDASKPVRNPLADDVPAE